MKDRTTGLPARLAIACAVLVAGAVLFGLLPAGGPRPAAHPATDHSAADSYGQLPLSFEPNVGQAGSEVSYLARGRGYRLSVERSGASLDLGRPDAEPVDVRLALVGADPTAVHSADEPLPGKVNHLVGDASQWHAGVPTYGRVTSAGVYPGIDVVWYGTQRGELEYDFVVAPGADPDSIRVAFEGVNRLNLDDKGALVLETKGGQLVQHPPVVYQESDGRRQPVTAGYVVAGHEVGFSLGSYDPTRPLVIDPVLAYSTYLGGNSGEAGEGIAVDAAGNAHVVGFTSSRDFPTVNPARPSHGGETYDAFVSKLNPAGSALLYSTYLGGSQHDEANAVALDAIGNAYVVGGTSSPNFPTLNPYDASANGESDAFVTKLSPSGALVYSTYLGGSMVGSFFNGDDIGTGVAVDASGSALVTGRTRSNDFPTLNPIQPTRSGLFDAFVTKLTPAGSGLVYSTYLGGTIEDLGESIAVDSGGNALVTGSTLATNFPVMNAIQPNNAGSYDAFVTKLNPAGSAFVYSTYLGGTNYDEASDVAVDGSGNAYLTGNTDSSNFPRLNAFDSTLGGDTDAFVTKLSPSGALGYSTYLGGTRVEEGDYAADGGLGIAVNGAGEAHVTGWTGSENFPLVDPIQPVSGGLQDVFVTKLNVAGTALVYSTYLGGDASDEEGRDIAVRSGDAFVTGVSDSPGGFTETEFPTTPGAFQTVNPNPSGSAIVVKISDGAVDEDPPPPADFDGDGDSDVAVYRPSSGYWFVNGGSVTQFGTTGDIPVPGDYDGDGDVDVAVYRPSSGYWFVHGGPIVQFGTTGDIPVPGDYDGDGGTDVAVYRPSSGYWFVNGGPIVQFGTSGDIPVPGDYDGDGDTDVAVYRPSSGYWFVNGGPIVAFGTTGDIPVPGDYDGDNDTDVAVYRPSTGYWFVNGGPIVAFGTTGDIPVPGDYDGDGDTDVAVYRPSTGYWFVNGGPIVAFGTTGDIPLTLPSAIRTAFFS